MPNADPRPPANGTGEDARSRRQPPAIAARSDPEKLRRFGERPGAVVHLHNGPIGRRAYTAPARGSKTSGGFPGKSRTRDDYEGMCPTTLMMNRAGRSSAGSPSTEEDFGGSGLRSGTRVGVGLEDMRLLFRKKCRTQRFGRFRITDIGSQPEAKGYSPPRPPGAFGTSGAGPGRRQEGQRAVRRVARSVFSLKTRGFPVRNGRGPVWPGRYLGADQPGGRNRAGGPRRWGEPTPEHPRVRRRKGGERGAARSESAEGESEEAEDHRGDPRPRRRWKSRRRNPPGSPCGVESPPT